MRHLASLLAVLALAGCSGSADTDDRPERVAASSTTPSDTAPGDPTSSATTSPSSTVPPTSTPPTAPPTTATPPPPTTTAPPTTPPTTIAPVVVEACRSLNEDPVLDDRTRTWSEAADQAEIEQHCPDAVALVRDALVIVERQGRYDVDGEQIDASIDCLDDLGRVSFFVEHDFDFDLGTVFLPTVRFVDATGATIERSGVVPAVDLDLPPGEKNRITAVVPASDEYAECGFIAPIFIADDPDLAGDGTRPIDRKLAPQAFDDVDIWLAELVAAERAYRTDGARFDTFADLHGAGWVNSRPSTPTALGALVDDPDATYRVCDLGAANESERHALLTFQRSGLAAVDGSLGDSGEDAVFVGLLRRGADGRWRWLVGVDQMDASTATCEAWQQRTETEAP